MTRTRRKGTPGTSARPLNAALNPRGLRVVLADGTEALDLEAWARLYVQTLMLVEQDHPTLEVPEAA